MNRTRTQGYLEPSWHTVQDFLPDGTSQGPPTYSQHLSKANGSFQTTTDVTIPDFRRRKASGEVFMNPFTVVKTKRSATSVNFTWGNHPGWGRREMKGTLACHWSVPPVRPTWFNARIADAQARTIQLALSRVANEDFLGLVTVAEAAKTARMIARPFGTARDLITRIADRKLKLMQKGLTASAAFSAAWLEGRLGWKPVLHDIQGIQEAYINNLVHFEEPVRFVARAGDRNIVWDSLNNISDTAHPGVTNVKMVANYSHRAKVSSGVLYELRDDSLESATARRMGLRLEDVPASLWELVPYSWVVDRFLDVGVWLNAIIPKPGVNILGSWTTTIDYALNYHQIVEAKIIVNTPPATTYVQTGGDYTEETQNITRVVNPAAPIAPTVNYRDLNLAQQTDHLALIIAKLVGLKTRT